MISKYHAHLLRKNRAAGTIRLRLHYLQRFAHWWGRDLAEADHDDLLAYLNAHPDWSDATRHSASATLSVFYRWSHKEGLIDQNPARDLPAVLVRRRPQRIASETAIRAAIQCDSISDRAMVLLGAECGLRVGEIASLHLTNRNGAWLNIVGKGGQERRVALSPELQEILDEIERTTMRHGWYFPGRSGTTHMHLTTAWRHISTVLQSNPHSLRRRAGTVVYRNSGHDLRLAQTFLGHARVTTTELYLDVQDDDLERASLLTRVA